MPQQRSYEVIGNFSVSHVPANVPSVSMMLTPANSAFVVAEPASDDGQCPVRIAHPRPGTGSEHDRSPRKTL
jgi:hypothetical protein